MIRSSNLGVLGNLIGSPFLIVLLGVHGWKRSLGFWFASTLVSRPIQLFYLFDANYGGLLYGASLNTSINHWETNYRVRSEGQRQKEQRKKPESRFRDKLGAYLNAQQKLWRKKQL